MTFLTIPLIFFLIGLYFIYFKLRWRRKRRFFMFFIPFLFSLFFIRYLYYSIEPDDKTKIPSNMPTYPFISSIPINTTQEDLLFLEIEINKPYNNLIANMGDTYLAEHNYWPYNPCILLLPPSIWNSFCSTILPNQKDCHNLKDDIYAITWFVRIPKELYGSLIYLGFITGKNLYALNTIKNHKIEWLMEPTYVQNIPKKVADPRLFYALYNNNRLLLGASGGTLISMMHTNEYKINMNYSQRVVFFTPYLRDNYINSCFILHSPNCTTLNLYENGIVDNQEMIFRCCLPEPETRYPSEFFVDCNVHPNGKCLDNMAGVEIHMDDTGIPRKNLAPLLLDPDHTSNNLVFVDFASEDKQGILISIIDVFEGKSLNKTYMEIHTKCKELTTREWRGSSQIIPLQWGRDGKLEKVDEHFPYFIALLHKRDKTKVLNYIHQLVLLKGELLHITIEGQYYTTWYPKQCLKLIDLDPLVTNYPHDKFYFATGLAPIHTINSTQEYEYNFIATFGSNNHFSWSKLITLTLPSYTKIEVSNESLHNTKIEISNESLHNIFLMWCGHPPSNDAVKQFRRLTQGIHFFHPKTQIYFVTQPKVLPDTLLNEWEKENYVHIIHFDRELFKDTPVANLKFTNWREMSDVIRLVLMWKYGGSWIDTDDLIIHELPTYKNVLPILEWPDEDSKSYWGSKFTLIDGEVKSSFSKNMTWKFHTQNDPILNFEPKHPFLYEWLTQLGKSTLKPDDWGQFIPTEMIRKNPSLAKTINLMPQYNFIIHPAFAYQYEYKGKGPLFPPYDMRVDNLPHYDEKIDENRFWSSWANISSKYQLGVIKNSKLKGWIQVGMEKRDYPGWFTTVPFDDLKDRTSIYSPQ